MFFIYGTGSYNRRNVVSQHAHCRECGTTTDQHSYDAVSYFTLYWLPLIPTGTKHYTRVCAECDKGLVSFAIAEGLLDFERYSRVCEDVGSPGAHYQRCIVLGDAEGAIGYLVSDDVLELATDHLLLFALAKAGGEDAIAADQLAVAKEMMLEQVADEFAALFEGAEAPDVGTAMRVSAESGALFYGLAALAYLYPENEKEFLAAADQHSWQNPLDQLLYKRLTLLSAER